MFKYWRLNCIKNAIWNNETDLICYGKYLYNACHTAIGKSMVVMHVSLSSYGKKWAIYAVHMKCILKGWWHVLNNWAVSKNPQKLI